MSKYFRITDIKLKFEENEDMLLPLCARASGVSEKEIIEWKIYRKSLDLRKGKEGKVYSVDIRTKTGKIKSKKYKSYDSHDFEYNIPRLKADASPIVVGFGPSGMFSALLLARAGLNPIIIERGKKIEDRIKDVNEFINRGKLDTESNVQFGEGGAGAFSDGKLNTLLGEKNNRGRFVLTEFVKAGAPDEILYSAKPHIGTDRIRECVKNIRKEIEALGGSFLFKTKFESFVIENNSIKGITVSDENGERTIFCNTVFLGIGHSARDSFRNIIKQSVPTEKKAFSVGVRIEHKQSDIDSARYKVYRDMISDPADYKLSVKTENGRILYTFCMCPGGIVIPASSEINAVVTNGMSNYARNGENSNSALLCSVDIDSFDSPEDAISFQEDLERKAFRLGGEDYKAPCQLVGDFLSNRVSSEFGKVKPSYGIGTRFSDLRKIFPEYISDTLALGIKGMGKLISGFDADDAVLTAVESRSTSPIRITRDENHQSSVKGIYPMGEGAGYSGGIMSSAIDGMITVEKYFETLKK